MFKYILGFSAFALASCAAFFSVKGIALLFAASFWSVAVMAGSMELAKLVSASYLYRYWNEINKILKRYMLCATILLMIITSLGIFGFLSDAFQRNFSQYSLNIIKINNLKSQQSLVVSQIDFNKNKLKDLIELQKTYQTSLDSAVKQDVTTTKTTGGGLFSSAKTEKVTDAKLIDSRNKIVEGSQQNINSLFAQISVANQDLQDLEKQASSLSQEILKLENDNTRGEIGTFKFIAEAFGLKIETAVRIFIILIVIVFDPLAVCLVIAYNSIVRNKKITSEAEPIIVEKIIEKPVEIVKNVFKEFKRGTKRIHNELLADPNLPENQTDKYIKKTYK
jgi:hypothetical protein